MRATRSAGTQPWLFIVVVGLALTGVSQSAGAVTCGDTIGPGDAVVTLDADLVCAGDAPKLRVVWRATLDLNGHRIDCAGPVSPGAVDDIGILVEGAQAEIRNGTIANCKVGVKLVAPGAGLHVVSDVTFQGNRLGIHALVGGNTITRNTFLGNLLGFFIKSESNIITHNTGEGNASAFVLSSGANRNRLLFNSATRNVQAGFDLGCDDEGCNDNIVSGNVALQNGWFGFRVSGERNSLLGNRSTENGFDGFDVERLSHVVAGHVSKRNGGDGLRLRGQYHVAENNVVKNNKGAGIAIRPPASFGAFTIISNTVLGTWHLTSTSWTRSSGARTPGVDTCGATMCLAPSHCASNRQPSAELL